MNYFIKNIEINKLLHLQDFDIPIANENTPHLILTGKNGSGKTILLNAIADFLDIVWSDRVLDFLKIENNIDDYRHYIENAKLMQNDCDFRITLNSMKRNMIKPLEK